MLSAKQILRSCSLVSSLSKSGTRLASVESTTAKKAPFSYMEAARRRKIRDTIKPIPAADEDPDFWIFPDERLGNTYSVNEGILKHDVVAANGDAFRNLHERGLKQRLPRSPPAASSNGEMRQYSVANQADSAAGKVGSNHIRLLHKKVTQHLSQSSEIYVHDGAIGSDRTSELKVRVITNSAATALLLRETLSRARLGKTMAEFTPDLCVYIDQQLPGKDAAQFGASSVPFSVFHAAKNSLYIVGDSSADVLRTTLSSAAAQILSGRTEAAASSAASPAASSVPPAAAK